MLLTVETLPDLSYNNSSVASKQIAVSPTMMTTNHRTAAVAANAIRDRTSPQRTIENNNITTISPQQRSYQLDMYNNNNNYMRTHLDMIETSSITTTTLTPTESRCNTPASEHQYSRGFVQHDDLYYDTDTQMNLHGGKYQYNDNMSSNTKRQIENLRNSSQSVMEVLQNRSSSRASDNIPYHAREFSKPFTYLDDAKSFKMHSGLSSPSMVRKALNNGSSSGRKTPLSHEFEERARYRRNYESSKYTFGDKTPENHLSVFDNDKWLENYRTRSENNKYLPYRGNNIEVETTTPSNHHQHKQSTHYFEPLRRSNTMDGSFGRSGYASDG
jgi:hypothetical protein